MQSYLKDQVPQADLQDLPGDYVIDSFRSSYIPRWQAADNFWELPIWIFSQLVRPRDRPVTNVVAVVVILITFIPSVIAHHLTQENSE